MIFGLESKHALPENWTPLEAVAIVKCLDQDGEVALDLAATAGVTSWESLGMLVAASAATLEDLLKAFRPDEEEGD
jgi:hypothetical protein